MEVDNHKKENAMKVLNALGKTLWAVPLVVGLVACGGDSSDSNGMLPDTSDPAPEGFYAGTSDLGAQLIGVVLDNGDYYVLYGEDSGGIYQLQGVVQGRGTARGDRFTSSNARDFNFVDGQVYEGSLDATFTRKQNLTGEVVEDGSGDEVGFSLAYEDSYEQTPDLTEDAGTYEGTALNPGGQGDAEVDIDTQGNFSGVDDFGCTFNGTVAPRESGDVYNLNVTFEGGTCTYDGETLQGIAIAQDGDLIAVAPTADRTGGIFFIGQIPPVI
ncbi:hypothetical protein [Alloalcanivorax gelatiniphagus]|uniref:Transferrin-binding protein B C-lobe/N-lobe beta barrel domain-containing protein n=1 Tax=Alloalcanivorax gelatiniphagus TaxID=1194167 RepID=A0ABY2XRM4_9GAMM|nr:hypothetical protein [Alloalcanivorax gelatiniphagus]TMW15192.1 hypothetical protein FGS76_00020 [Alloalcanivorax gelatiniphagus]